MIFRKNLPLLFLSLTLIFTGCKNATTGEDKQNQDNSEPKENLSDIIFPKQNNNASGACSLAYYLALTNQIEAEEIEDTAQEIYEAVKFDPQAEDGFFSYCNPLYLAEAAANFDNYVEIKMTRPDAPSKAEEVLSLLLERIGIEEESYTVISSIEDSLAKDQYLIEILIPENAESSIDLEEITDNKIHYVLSYWYEDKLVTRDPFRGDQQPRSSFIDGSIESWQFCNGGIFLKPKN